MMFIGDIYWRLIYLFNYKCFIIAVCMVLCGDICFVVYIVMTYVFKVQRGRKGCLMFSLSYTFGSVYLTGGNMARP